MKRLLIPTLVACAVIAASCTPKNNTASIGIQIENMDTLIAPGTNFYLYANGGWMKKYPLTPQYSLFSAFVLLVDQTREQVKEIIENLASTADSQSGVGLKVGTLYNVAMDSAKLNREGYEPLKAQLAQIAAISSKEALVAMIGEMNLEGINPYFSPSVRADEKSSTTNILCVDQGGLGLGLKEYYIDTDAQTLTIRNKYREHVAKMFALCGYSEASAQRAAQAVMQIETAIAKASKSMTELRDPQASYNMMTIDELTKAAPGVDWKQWLKGIGMEQVTKINIGQPSAVAQCANIIASIDIDTQKEYIRWNLINSAASFLSDDFECQNFDFYDKTLSGKQEQRPRWKRAVDVVNNLMSEAVGEIYVQKYFPAAAKERMLNLVSNLQKALGMRIDNLTWMSDSTKMAAHEKLSTMVVKVGYPDKWRDYSSLQINNDSYWTNIRRANRFYVDYSFSQINKPVDRAQWYMPAQMVNAYYNPTTNEICFPAGILQYPFFDMGADDAFNYGAIGVVIGHEMTHGFDDYGCQYDKHGNLFNWWNQEDMTKFGERTKGLVAQFDAISVLPDMKANGSLTLGENIADNGGIQVSYMAYKSASTNSNLPTVDGLTPDQRFFIAYSGVWAGNIRDEEIRVRTKSDPHSLGLWRVNGTLPNIDAWYEAFNIQPTDPMYIAPDKRIYIW